MSERNFNDTFSKLKARLGSVGKDTIANNLAFLLEFIHSAPVGLMATDPKGTIVLFNDRAKINLGIPVDDNEWIGKPVFELAAFSQKLIAYIEDFLRGERPPYDLMEIEVQDKHITVRGWLGTGGMMLALNDITLFKKMEAASLGATIEGQEAERGRLARELHDGIGPLLSTLNLYLEGLQPEFQNLNPEARQKYQSIRTLVNSLTREIRNISGALMPAAVEDLGLVAAVEDMVEKTKESAGIDVHFYHSGLKNRLDHLAELGLYRIIQELVNNTVKYAKARHVNVQLIRHKESVVLTYEDDGTGFDVETVMPAKGFGLRDIQARVKSLGGNFSLDTSPGRGLIATVEIPLVTR
jgi:signal transduction histidine kinase